MKADGSDQRQLTRDIAAEPDYSVVADRIIYSKPQFGGIVALFTIRPDGALEQGIDEQFWDNWEPAFAPDGQRIAFTSSRENRDWEIYTRNPWTGLLWADCGPDSPAGFPELLKWAPAWSPDGEKIAFVVSTERDQYAGEANIWVMDAATGANCRPLTDTPGVIDKYPDWSPDGRQIVFASNRNGDFELFVMDADGRNQRPVDMPVDSPDHINYPAWSPDGNWFTFSASITPRDIN
jgi:TolB protein